MGSQARSILPIAKTLGLSGSRLRGMLLAARIVSDLLLHSTAIGSGNKLDRMLSFSLDLKPAGSRYNKRLADHVSSQQ